MKQFILILNGPYVGGKTSALEVIMKQYKKVFRLSPNKIKFLISDYNPERDRAVVHQATIHVAEDMLQNGMSIVMEGGSVMQGTLNDELKKLGEKYQVPVTTVNIEAPLPVLLSRFNDRVAEAPLKGSKLSVTTEEEFMKRYNAYLAIKDQAAQTFNSETENPGDIAKAIMALVQ